MPGELGLGVVEVTGHADVLGALTREQEDDPVSAGLRRRAVHRLADEHVVVLFGGQHLGRVLPVADHGRHPDRVGPAVFQGVCHVGQCRRLRATQFGGQLGACLGQRLGRPGRQQQHLGAGHVDGRHDGRRLFEHHVGVGAAHPERADAGPPDTVPLPVAVLAAHHEGTLVDVQLGIRAGVVQRGGNGLVLQAQDRLDQRRHAGRRLQVADVRLDRADVARARTGLLGDLESLSQRLDLDRVAQRGAGAVGLDVADGGGVDLGDRVRLGHDVGLTGHRRRRVGHLRRAVVVQRRAADDRVDAVAVVDRVLQRLEDDDAHAAGEDGAVGAHVERAAVTGGRHHRTGVVPVADVVRDAQRRRTRQRHVGLAVEDALAGQVHRDQRRGAGGLHRQGRAAQVELVGHPGGQVVLVVLHRQVDHVEGDALADDRLGVVVRHQVVQQVAAGGAGGEDTHGRVDLRRCVAGILERVVGLLQEQPVLGVHRARGLRGEAEELGVELVDAPHQPGAPHIRVVRQRLRADALGQQIVLRQGDDRFSALAQVVPELRHRIGAGEPAGHADDGNRVVRQRVCRVVVGGHARSPTFRRAAARCRAAARLFARSRTPSVLSVDC